MHTSTIRRALLAAALLAAAAHPAHAQASRVRLHVEPGALDSAEARRVADRVALGLDAIERTIERPIALAGDGHLDVYVARGGVAPADARRDPSAIVLDAARLDEWTAPWLHEIAALAARDLDTRATREELASAIAAEAQGWRPSAVVDATPEDRAAHAALATIAGERALRLVGRRSTVDPAADDRAMRAAYRDLSRSFARHLVAHVGSARALRLLEARDAGAYRRLTGHTLVEWQADWLAAIGAGRSSAA